MSLLDIPRQTAVVAVWTVVAVALMVVAILTANHPLWGTASLIAMIALVFPGIPMAAIAMERP